jgi:hypothetical protein
MDVTRTIRQDLAQRLHGWLNLKVLGPERLIQKLEKQIEQSREEFRHRPQEHKELLRVVLDDFNQVTVSLVSTGSLMAITAAVKKFRKRPGRGKVEVDEAQEPGDKKEPGIRTLKDP